MPMSWNELQLNPSTLEASTVNQVYENCLFLAEALEEANVDDIDSEAIVNPNAQMSTPISEIGDILTTIEEDLLEINNGVFDDVNVVSVYFGEMWELNPTFSLQDYQRWVLILNDIYDIIINGKGVWKVLELNDCIPTIDDKEIAIRGEVIA